MKSNIIFLFVLFGIVVTSCKKEETDVDVITYPEFSSYGENLLFEDKVDFSSSISMSADLGNSASLKVVIRGAGWGYRTLPDGPVNWRGSDYTQEDTINVQTFTVKESGKDCDVSMMFFEGSHVIEIYENESSVPTRVKTFIKKPVSYDM